MADELTSEDVELILTSLDHTRRAFQKYAHYPSAELQKERVEDVSRVVAKVRAIRDHLAES